VPDSLFRSARVHLLAVMLPLCAIAAAAAPASPWLERSWETDEGLPGNVVVGIGQDSGGYIWVATENGLVRFDGVRFEPVELQHGPGHHPTKIRAMARGSEGDFWVGTDGAALVHFDENGSIDQSVEDGLPESEPVAIAQDRDGSAWVAFLNRSVCRISNGQAQLVGAAEGLPGGGVCSLATDTNGRLWLAQGGHIGIIKDGRFQPWTQLPESGTRIAASHSGGVWICAGFQLYKYAEDSGLTTAGVLAAGRSGLTASAMLEDRTGALWVGTTTRGLFRVAGGRSELIPTSHQEILSLAEDREGDIWVGTAGGGLDRLTRRVLELEGTESGLPFESIISLCEETNGTRWAVNANGGLARSEGTTWSAIIPRSGWTGGLATCVAAGRQGGVWIGTRTKGLYEWAGGQFSAFTPGEGLTSQHIRALLPASSGDLWIGMDGVNLIQRLHHGVLSSIDLPGTNAEVRAIVEDASGHVWLGTREGLLLRVDGDTFTDMTPATESSPSAIRCLEATPDGSVWIGYAGAGIGRWRDGHYGRVSMSQGLLESHVSQMVADDRGSLWLAGKQGICQVLRSELEAAMADPGARVRSIVYGRDENMASLEANYGHCPNAMRGGDGRIWFGTKTGLAVVHAANVQDNLQPPPVIIENMLVDGRRASPGSAPGGGVADAADPPVRVRPDHHTVNFEFTALSFVAPENVSFRYRLDGVDVDWIDGGTKRSAGYPRLPSGRYQFHVIACNNTGVWNQRGAVLAFEVLPFFWQTWWFRSTVVAAFSISLIALVRYVSFRRLREELQVLEEQAALHRERARIAKDMHDDLGANLTQIALLSELASQDLATPEKAGPHIQKITGTARQVVRSLDEIVWAVNPRNDTLAHLIDYAGQFALDFLRPTGIRCRLDLPESPPARTIPADVRHNLFLVIKEALHNIMKHARASEVWLRAAASSDGLVITVEDNGCGFDRPPDNSWSDGLRNMSQRISDIGGECSIESHPGAGTKVILRIPWPQNLPE
jgi:ligand-binding sensor domain-containing protein/signal transduction histidine kinase